MTGTPADRPGARTTSISPRQPYWLDRLSREHPNLRAAVEYSLAEPGQAEAVLRIAVTMPWAYWVTRGMFGEARHWLDAGLARITPRPACTRGAVVGGLSGRVAG